MLCGLVRSCVVWCCLVLSGIECCGAVRPGVVLSGVVWSGMECGVHGVVWCGLVWCWLVWCWLVWSVVWCGVVLSSVQCCVVLSWFVRCGLVWSCLVCSVVRCGVVSCRVIGPTEKHFGYSPMLSSYTYHQFRCLKTKTMMVSSGASAKDSKATYLPTWYLRLQLMKRRICLTKKLTA